MEKSLIDYLEDFYTYKMYKDGVCSNRITLYRNAIKKFIQVAGNRPLHEYKLIHIIQYHKWLLNSAYKNSTKKGHNDCMRIFAKRCFENNLPFVKIADLKIRIVVSAMPKYLEDRELEAILEYADKLITPKRVSNNSALVKRYQKRALVRLYSKTAGRKSEIVNLRWRDIDFSSNTATVIIKGGRACQLCFTQEAKEKLLEYKEVLNREFPCTKKAEYVFIAFNRRIDRPHTGIYEIIKNIGNKVLGKIVTPHMFRHTVGKQWMEKGATFRETQEKLNHLRPESTQIYTYVGRSQINKLTEKFG